MRTNTDHTSASPPEKVTIAYSATPNAALAEVAQKLGYYVQEGLEATPLMRSHGKAALKEVLEGKADFATVAETPVMFAVMEGRKISIIATIEISNKNSAIVARKDRGIRIPRDLRGRKIGATSGTTSDFFMDAFLAVHGISRNDVEVTDLKPEELQIALVHGDVDAASVFNPYVIQLQRKLGNRGTILYNEDIYTQTFNIVATQEYIHENPGKIKKMLSALIRAEEFTRRNRVEAQKIVADFSRMDAALVREIWADATFSVRLEQSLVLAMEDESQWAMNSGFIARTKIPNYLDFIYFDGLESVKPEAVRILR